MLARTTTRLALFLALIAGLVGVVPASAQTPSPSGDGSYDPDHVLVAFQPGVGDQGRAATHSAEGGRVENRMEWLNLDVVRIPDDADPRDVVARYERNPVVAYAELNWETRLTSVPNDGLFDEQWGFDNTGQTGGTADADIDGPEGWTAAFGTDTFENSGGTTVGVLDTGIDRTHLDLQGETVACAQATTLIGVVVEGTCEDDNGHGTHVGGTISALTGNGRGVAGTAPSAQLAVFKGLNAAGVGFYGDIIAGIHWLYTEAGASVISMSIGGPQSDSLDRELENAYQAGVLLVAAAGNDGDDTLNWPAAHRDVISVAATDHNDERAEFSNCNGDVELAAPGVDILSTFPGNLYAWFDGTSMATPHVSGVGAMVMSEKALDNVDTRSQLANTADDVGSNGRDLCFGYGRVNLASALGTTDTSSPPPGDPGAIAGHVYDANTDAGISGATVDCGTAGSATTDSNGAYSIGEVAPGSYTCTASATGYRSKSQNVTVDSGQTTTADFALRKDNGGGGNGNGGGKGKPS